MTNNIKKNLNNVKVNFIFPKFLTLKVLNTFGSSLEPNQGLGKENLIKYSEGKFLNLKVEEFNNNNKIKNLKNQLLALNEEIITNEKEINFNEIKYKKPLSNVEMLNLKSSN